MIGFAGLSHLGIVSSLSVASKGFQVVGYDPDPQVVGMLSKGQVPILEDGLPELLRDNGRRISYTCLISDLKACDVVYISRDVPTSDSNVSDLSSVCNLIETVAAIMKPGATLVILCQVPPGFTRKVRQEVIALRNADDLQIVYQVETLVFGSAVERALHPERYIIGYGDGTCALPTKMKELLESFGCPILCMRYESAELAKIAINVFLISSVMTTNIVSEVCEHIGADWSEIEGALRLDKRIGNFAYLKPGVGIAGGNLERDLVTITKMTREFGVPSSLFDSWREINSVRRDWILKKLLHTGVLSAKNPHIALWGLAYKPGTLSLKNAPSLELLNSLHGASVHVYDPEVHLPDECRSDRIWQARSAIDALEGAAALVIMTPWPEFRCYTPEEIQSRMPQGIVIDPHGIFANREMGTMRYVTMGKGART